MGRARIQPGRISTRSDVLVKLLSMAVEYDDQEGLRRRSEQAIGELAQALLDSQVLENAVAAAFGAREKAHEAQLAAMSALNLPSAGDVERLERGCARSRRVSKTSRTRSTGSAARSARCAASWDGKAASKPGKAKA